MPTIFTPSRRFVPDVPTTTVIKRSDAVTAGPSRAAARSYYRATGMSDADFDAFEDALDDVLG